MDGVTMKKIWPWLLGILLLVIVDQVSKYLIVINFAQLGDKIDIIGDFLQLKYVRNAGAAFGLGSDCICVLTDTMYSSNPLDFSNVGFSTYFFIAMFLVALVAFGWLFAKNDFGDKRRIWYSISLMLLIAGALGNTIDRIFQPDHCVVDFIAFSTIWDAVFNVADACLTVGITLLLIDQFLLEPRRSKQNAS